MNLPSRQKSAIDQVQQLYQKLDGEIEDFKKATSLGCVNGCGRCCENPEVYVTVLEVLPLALSLWNEGKAQDILEHVRCDQKGWCVFYAPDPLVKGNGRCLVYAQRPLICRLFGFATKKDKYGNHHLVTCSTIKHHCTDHFSQAEKSLSSQDNKIVAPSMQEYAMNIYNIDPSLGRDQFPINKAIGIAIEKIAMLMQNEEKK